MKKKHNSVKYTDMCIYIDQHIHDKDADHILMYSYLVDLSHMLTVKKDFFNNEKDRENFSYYFANLIYMRLTDKRQFLPKTDPKYIKPVKSVLNYMKTVLYGKMCNFLNIEYGKELTPEQVKEVSNQYYANCIRNNASTFITVEMTQYIKNVPAIIYDILKRGVYGRDKALLHQLYIATLISFLRSITLSNTQKEKLKKADPTNIKVYDSIVDRFLVDCEEKAPINYNLPEEYLDYIAITLQIIKKRIIADIRDLTKDYDVSDSLIEGLIIDSIKNYREDEEENG